MAPALETDWDFIGYSSGAITLLHHSSGVEESFANLSSEVTALVPFENLLFANNDWNRWGTFLTLNLNGHIISSVDFRVSNPSQVWNSAMPEMLRADSEQLVAQRIEADGNLGDERFESFSSSTTRSRSPINKPERAAGTC